MDIRSSIMFHCNSLNVIKSSTAFILWSLAQVMAEKCFTDCGDHSFGVLFRLPFWLVVLIHGMVLCSSTPFCAQFEMPQPVQHFANLPCLHMVYYPYIYIYHIIWNLQTLPCLLLLQDPSGTFTKYVAGQKLGSFFSF